MSREAAKSAKQGRFFENLIRKGLFPLFFFAPSRLRVIKEPLVPEIFLPCPEGK